ncbi:MAG: CoA pyrophosphatase [Planctomycetes bacterium]|nr:CoA pyrophosphatase [Planctomycetota bacterium]
MSARSPWIEGLRLALGGRARRELPAGGWKPAAVLVPLLRRHGTESLLLTRRSEEVATHRGQVCFPGGRRDPRDRDLAETALREAKEELGIPAAAVDLLGALDDCRTLTSSFLITPFVGYLPEDLPLSPRREEVAEVLEIPLGALLATGARTEEVRRVGGAWLPLEVYVWREARIWGATARILGQLLPLVRSLSVPPHAIG